jgi:uncharacterized protein YndB with AHSA1/START domain
MTTKEAAAEAVRKSITVEAPAERAFEVFTSGMGRWWPLDTHHIGATEPNEVVVEPRAGGRWFERAPDGSECDWGRVIAWEPPQRVVFGWHLGPEWKYDPDPAFATEVEVRFVPEGATRTRVELEHRGFEVHGDRADELRIPVSGEGGWGTLLERFAKEAAA